MTEPRYRAVPRAELRIVPLDSMTAIYHRASGITHLVASPAPEILDALADAPLSRGDVLVRLTADFDLEDGDEAALGARLDELVAAGLVFAA